jgi:hypothetical protein
VQPRAALCALSSRGTNAEGRPDINDQAASSALWVSVGRRRDNEPIANDKPMSLAKIVGASSRLSPDVGLKGETARTI